MTFARKLTLAMALLLSLTLSAGGAWTIGRNFSAALDTAAADAAARHLRERYAVEELLAGTGGQPGDIARAVFGYARSLRAAGGSGYCFAVLDGSGTVLWSDLPRAVSFASQWQAVQAGAGAMLYCGSADDAWLVLASPLQGQDTALYLVGGYDVTAQFAEHGRQLWQYLAVECAALALAVGAAALLAWGLTRPLRRLEAASRDLAAGDYARRVPPGGGTEFARLADGFNTMAGAVQANMDALRRQDESRARFVAAFTHELKTPMTAILGYADLLRSGEQPADVRQLAADYIYHESARLETLSRELLTLLGLEQGPPPAQKPEPVSGIFADVVRSLPAPAPVQVAQSCPPGAAVCANRALLADLVRNLLLNAAAASPADGCVRLTCAARGDCWRITVADRGRGIPPGDLPHVTEPFYMADKSRTRARGGSGMGLSLCAAIAAAHGTTLHIESEPGRGTAVWLELPAAGLPAAPPAEKEDPPCRS